MRRFLAALALAGALSSCGVPLPGPWRVEAAAQGADARDVTRARRCAPPLPRCKRAPRPARPDHRAYVAQLVDAAAIAEGVPLAMARALVLVESNFAAGLVGRAGEVGLTQIKYATARGLGFTGSRAELFAPAVNLKWGLRHARRALDRGSIGFHQAGLYARRVSSAYVARIHAAM